MTKEIKTFPPYSSVEKEGEGSKKHQTLHLYQSIMKTKYILSKGLRLKSIEFQNPRGQWKLKGFGIHLDWSYYFSTLFKSALLSYQFQHIFSSIQKKSVPTAMTVLGAWQ